MFIDTRQVSQDKSLIATVCIIGGGVAGISIARELEKQGIDTCLLESGGLQADHETRDLYRGKATGLNYQFADGCRARFLGGSSNCWGGWSRPLDAWDFEQRDWVPYSGWPFGLSHLEPYYRRTHQVLKLGPNNFDPSYWEKAIARSDVRRIPLKSGKVRDTISQFSPPVRFGKAYRPELRNARYVRVFLYANVTQIIPDPLAGRIKEVTVQTLTGKQMRVAARIFILATGGIENARLLLASNRIVPAGLGNQHDLVGRFFMEHPRLLSGDIHFSREWSRNKLYDIKYHYMNSAVAAQGVHIAAQLALTPETLEKERLLNARICFCSEFPGEGSQGAQALFRCKQALLSKDQPGWRLRDDVMTMVKEPLNTFAYGFTRLFHPRAMIKKVSFQVIIEPAPSPDSRVSLSSTQKDALGMPRVEVDWRLDTQVRRTADRSLALIASELRQTGIAHVNLDPSMELHGWPATMEPEGTWHHMGTTRMHSDEKQGVVDADCKVHGLANLYIAGSSVFPTAGANFPTITITALALRLAEHVIGQLKNISSTLVEEIDLVQNTSVSVENPVTASINVNGLPAV
jgi:choline dehydrogenase-like flavoprotein